MDIHFYIELTNTVGKRNWTEEEEDGKKKYLVMHVCNEKKGKRKKGKTNVRKKKKREEKRKGYKWQVISISAGGAIVLSDRATTNV